jgi:hypothetical protein
MRGSEVKEHSVKERNPLEASADVEHLDMEDVMEMAGGCPFTARQRASLCESCCEANQGEPPCVAAFLRRPVLGVERLAVVPVETPLEKVLLAA